MLTSAEISAGNLRLSANKLTQVDVSKMVSAFERVFAGLQSKYNYDFKTKLGELDDSLNSEQEAAQVAGILIKLEALGFGVAHLKAGGRGGVDMKQRDQYLEFVLYAFSKIYPIPPEFSTFDLMRAAFARRATSSSFESRREF